MWTYSNAEEEGEYFGGIEFEVKGEYHFFEMFHTPERLVFGSFTNTGFMESGYMEIDKDFSLDENLATCLDLLDEYYRYNTNEELFLTERM